MKFPRNVENLRMYTEIVDQHDEVLDIWRNLGIKDALVLHVDAHSDIAGGVSVDLVNGQIEDTYSSIENFLTIASYEGVIDNLYWLNPHHNNDRVKLQYVGSKGDLENTLDVVLEKHDEDIGHLNWVNPDNFGDLYRETTFQKLKLDAIKYHGNLVLDIDLDAFCADTTPINGKIVHNMTGNHYDLDYVKNYDGSIGWKQRVDETITMLKGLDCNPRLITIARSTHGMSEDNSWVPIDKVDQVQEYLLDRLHELYR